MTGQDGRRLQEIGAEVWPDPAEAFGNLLTARSEGRRHVCRRIALGAVGIAVAVVALIVLLPRTTPPPRQVAAGGTASARPAAGNVPAAQPEIGDRLTGIGATVQAVDTNAVFSPAAVTITVGQAVEFTNPGSAVHRATSVGGTWTSGDLGPGQSYVTPAFDTPGAYAFDGTSTAAAGMVGTIVVRAPPPAVPVPLMTSPLPTAVIAPTTPVTVPPAFVSPAFASPGVVPSPGPSPATAVPPIAHVVPSPGLRP